MSLPPTSTFQYDMFDTPVPMPAPDSAATSSAAGVSFNTPSWDHSFSAGLIGMPTGMPSAAPAAASSSSSPSSAAKPAPKRRGRISSKPKPPFACFVCGKQFKRHEHMSRHQATHSEDTKYPCSICGKTFRRQDVMHRHTLTHAATHDTSSLSRSGNRSSKTKTNRQTAALSRSERACLPCKRAKLRCDGATPCSRCINKVGAQCIYTGAANDGFLDAGLSASSSTHSPAAQQSRSDGAASPSLDYRLGSPQMPIAGSLAHPFGSGYSQHTMYQPQQSLQFSPHFHGQQHLVSSHYSQHSGTGFAFTASGVTPLSPASNLGSSSGHVVSPEWPNSPAAGFESGTQVRGSRSRSEIWPMARSISGARGDVARFSSYSEASWTRATPGETSYASLAGGVPAAAHIPSSSSSSIQSSATIASSTPMYWHQQIGAEYGQTPRPSTSGSAYGGRGDTEAGTYFPGTRSESGGSDFSVESLEAVTTPTTGEISSHSELQAPATDRFMEAGSLIMLPSPALALDSEQVKGSEWNQQPEVSGEWPSDAVSPLPIAAWNALSTYASTF